MAANTEALRVDGGQADAQRPTVAVSSGAVTVTHTPDTPDTQALVEAAKTGDRQAFAALYRAYLPQVYKFLYYRVHDKAKAEDMTAEVFLRALRKVKDFNWTGADFGAWLMRIARNLILDDAKSSRARLEIVADEMPEDSAGEAPTAESAVMETLTNETLYRGIKQLRPDQQEVITLRFLHGMSVGDVAQVMGKKEGTIRTLQFRGLKALQKVLAGQGVREDEALGGILAGGQRMGSNGRGNDRTESEAARYGVADGER